MACVSDLCYFFVYCHGDTTVKMLCESFCFFFPFFKAWPWAGCGVCAGLRGKEMLAHQYAGRTPLPQVLAALTNLPHTLTHLHTALRAHTQTHRCMQRSPSNKPTVQGCICRHTHAQFFWQIHMRAHAHTHSHIGAHILTHTLTCSSLHLFSCVLFFPAVVPTRRAAGKRSPRGGTGALIDSREFGGRRASKAALPLPLSSRPSALSARTTGGSLSFANTSRKN